MSDYIKFGENKRECVELAFDEPLTVIIILVGSNLRME